MRSSCIAAAIALVASIGCNAQQKAPLVSNPEAAARYTADSAKYVKDSIEYARQQRVLDSISRTVKTDSIYHLFRARLTATDLVAITGAVNCEQGRLFESYGSLPAQPAIERMMDTMKKKGEEDAWIRLDNRLGSFTIDETIRLGHYKCTPPLRGGRNSVDGVQLDGTMGPPNRPRRPGG